MGMRNDELSSREHAEMRDLLLAGTQRIRPAGSHRTQLIAGAAALVLVGAVAGGAVSAGTILGGVTGASPSPTPTEEPTPTQTQTPTPTPSSTPSPSVPAVPAAGVLPFDGACANALHDDEVSAIRANGMEPSQFWWRSGGTEVLGGIDCLWLSMDVYMDAEVALFAFPAQVVPAEVRDAAARGCAPLDYDTSRVKCTASGVVDGTWVFVHAMGLATEITQAEVDALFASASARVSEFAQPAPASRSAQWWSLPDCAQVVSQIDPAVFGYERVALFDAGGTVNTPSSGPESIVERSGVTASCVLHFTSGSGDAVSGETVSVSVVPGGGAYFESARAAEGSEPVAVDGAQAAVWARGLGRYEGSWAVLVVTDGVNTLMVSPDGPSEPGKAAPLAAALLAILG